MDILAKILARKREEIAALLRATTREALRQRAGNGPHVQSFYDALATGPAPRLIAEVKKASPSKGIIRADFEPTSIARAYHAGGAAALSVLTDRDFFQGDLSYLGAVRAAVPLPLLRKDFIIDPTQIAEARIAGASAILLIAAALESSQLRDLYAEARSLGLDVLVEVHDDMDVDKLDASATPARIVGINNRDLRTFNVDLAVTERLVKRLRNRAVIVSESGIFTPADVKRVKDAGVRAVLVGESLMREKDVAAATRALMGGSR